jgi:hypothetical protein
MLTMVNPLEFRVNGIAYQVFQDDGNEIDALLRSGGRPATTPRVRRFYVMPETPAIVRENGLPIFSLIIYRKDEERIDPAAPRTEDVGGGILTFSVELTIPKEAYDKIKGQLRTLVFGDTTDPADSVELIMVPFTDGKVSVAVAGELGTDTGTDREFVKTIVGAGKVSGIGNNRSAVMVKLTQAGGALLSQLTEINTLPINVKYELNFEHRLLGVAMRVWCDMASSFALIQEVLHTDKEYDDGYLGMSENHVEINKITSVTETMVRSKTAGVTVVPASALVDNETVMALEKYGFELLNKEMEKAIQASPPPEEIDRTYLTSFTQNYSSSFNFSLDRRMVLTRTVSPSANISNVFTPANFKQLVTFVDLRTDFFAFLKVPIRINADFDKLPLDSVTVTVRYERDRVGGGGREERVDSFNFTSGTAIQTFLAFANSLKDVAYDWKAEVHYKGSPQPYKFDYRRNVKDDFLVVDVGALGMIAVDIGLGLVDLEKFPRAKVAMRYRSTALNKTLEQEFMLDKDASTARWAEVIQEEATAGYEYKVDWLKKGGDILEGTWERSSASKLRLDAPIPDQLEVSLVCTGNFKDGPNQIAQVAVSLRYEDPDNAYTQDGHLVFTAEGQNLPWAIDIRNPQLRDYKYKYTIIYKDGVIRDVPEDGSWIAGQPGFVTVGEKYTVEVDIYPTLQKYPEHAKVVQVDLQYEDPANAIRDNGSFIFTADAPQNTRQTWRVRGKPNGPKAYRYGIKYFAADGKITELPAVVQENDAIVIPPAAAPGPGPTPPGQ